MTGEMETAVPPIAIAGVFETGVKALYIGLCLKAWVTA